MDVCNHKDYKDDTVESSKRGFSLVELMDGGGA